MNAPASPASPDSRAARVLAAEQMQFKATPGITFSVSDDDEGRTLIIDWEQLSFPDLRVQFERKVTEANGWSLCKAGFRTIRLHWGTEAALMKSIPLNCGSGQPHEIPPQINLAHRLSMWDKGKSAYESGDYSTAFREWLSLAERGDGASQNNVGSLYEKGQGVPQDDEQAFKWYQKAADQGLAVAQNNLGFCYLRGHGVTKDDVQAYMWFELAGPGTDKEDRDARADLARRLTSDQITQALALAEAWRAKTASVASTPPLPGFSVPNIWLRKSKDQLVVMPDFHALPLIVRDEILKVTDQSFRRLSWKDQGSFLLRSEVGHEPTGDRPIGYFPWNSRNTGCQSNYFDGMQILTFSFEGHLISVSIARDKKYLRVLLYVASYGDSPPRYDVLSRNIRLFALGSKVERLAPESPSHVAASVTRGSTWKAALIAGLGSLATTTALTTTTGTISGVIAGPNRT